MSWFRRKLLDWLLREEIEKLRVKELEITSGRTVYTDTINEKTANAGVTIDGCLIKDGKAADSDKVDGYEASELGGWKTVSEVNVTSDTDYVEWTGLAGNTDWFYKILGVSKNPTADAIYYYIFVNGDTTTTNYYYQALFLSGTTVTAGRGNDSRIVGVYAGNRCLFEVIVSKDSDGYFRYYSIACRETSSDVHNYLVCGTKTATITEIESLRISASASGGIGSGAKFVLLKARG